MDWHEKGAHATDVAKRDTWATYESRLRELTSLV